MEIGNPAPLIRLGARMNAEITQLTPMPGADNPKRKGRDTKTYAEAEGAGAMPTPSTEPRPKYSPS